MIFVDILEMFIRLRYLSVFCLIHVASGLYEDQVGIFDWKQSYVGHVTHATYDAVPDSAGNRAIFVAAAETGVVAALGAKDGGVIWRHVFSQDERVSFISLFNDCVLVLTGNTARCFYPEGIMKSQVTLPISQHETVRFTKSSEEATLFATDSNVCILRGSNFKCVPFPSQGSNFLVRCNDAVSVCIVSQDQSGLVTVYQAAVENSAKLIKLSSGQLNDQIVSCGGLSSGQAFMCLLANGKILGPVTFREFSSSNVGFVDPESCSTSSSGAKVKELKVVANNLLLSFDNGKKILCNTNNRSPFKFEQNALPVDAETADYNGKDASFVLLSEGGSSFRVVLLDETGSQLADSAFSSRELLNEGVAKLFPIVLKKRSSTQGGNTPILRALFKTNYDTLVFVQGGAVKWTRDEGLGQASSAIFFDLPLPGYLADIASEVVSQNSNIFLSFIRRVRFESDILFSTVFDLIDTFSNGGFGALLHFHKDTKHSLLHHQINRHTGDGRDVSVELHRDKFGLEKLILVITSPGKVFAIHSLTGVVVWDLILGNCRPTAIFQLRGTDNTEFPSVVAVVGYDISSNGQACVVSLDGLTGKMQESVTFPFLPGVVRPFVHADPETRMIPLLLINPARSTIYVYPSSLKDFVLRSSNDVYYHIITEAPNTNGLVSGFHLVAAKDSSDSIALSKTWSVRLPAGEHIVTLAERRPDERVHSKAVVLSDRSVLYRYINPNLIFVVTSTFPVDRKETEKEVLATYLIDAVSGRFYYQGQLRHARGPVHAVNAENFVVYSYWNSQMRRTEVAVIELFEGKSERNASVFSSFDYYGPDVPMVLKQAYVLNDIVRSMVVTTSRRGITSRSVLLGMASGRILEVPKLLLNPRRLLTHTPEHAEEGIPPYIPEIITHPESFINYNRSLERISNMYTAPSGLESTSLLFVSGLDLYFARVWPSKMFDMLKEDFDYAFIIMITGGLLAATFVFRYLVQMKELKKAWQ